MGWVVLKYFLMKRQKTPKTEDFPLLSAKEECRLGQIMRGGTKKEAERAREQFIMSNLRLVTAMAGNFKGKGVLWEDLIQEGTVGLIRAVDKFDPNRGRRFAVMAGWWIKDALQVAVSRANNVRIPPRVMAARKKEEEEDDNE
jgi:RNA polymerase primary sigma factor